MIGLIVQKLIIQSIRSNIIF